MCYNYCSICLSKIYKQKIKLKCNHSYHKECLKKWLKYNNSCPICRLEIDNDIINILNYNINYNYINCNKFNCIKFNCIKFNCIKFDSYNIKNCKEYLNFLNIKQK